ncbi:MAG: type II secretion system secretin GspD, partial [Mariprofundaceae bacterium]
HSVGINAETASKTTVSQQVKPKAQEGLERSGGSGDESSKSQQSVYAGTGQFVRGKHQRMLQNPSNHDPVMLNFNETDIHDVLRTILSDMLHQSYIDNDGLRGKISFYAERSINRGDLFPLLEQFLGVYGYTLVDERGVFHVLTKKQALQRGGVPSKLTMQRQYFPAGFSVQFVLPQFIGVAELAKILRPLAPSDSIVQVDTVRNLLMLSGTEHELRRLMETVNLFDVNWMEGVSVGLFQLHASEVKDVQPEIEKIFGAEANGPLAGMFRILPVERLNALLVITSQPHYLDQAERWISRLDRSDGVGGAARLHVYQVQNGKAEKIADLLNQVVNGASPLRVEDAKLAPGLKKSNVKSKVESSSASAKLPVGEHIRIIADADDNALLVMATAVEYEQIEATIRKLDVAPRQVLIEMTIAEVSLTGDLSYGLEWFFNANRNSTGRLDIGSVGISGLAPGFSMVSNTLAGDVRLALNMLASDSRLNIISSPHIMVLDNHTAKIQVGDRVPTTTQSQSAVGTATGIINSIQYLDTGIMLSVTPHINAGGKVTLEVIQEVSNAKETVTSGIDSPTISKRSSESTVIVQSGETMVLAGLIQENETNTSTGIPLLSSIPVIGALFGSKSKKNNRTELVMLLTPRVVHDGVELRNITHEFKRRFSMLADRMKENDE